MNAHGSSGECALDDFSIRGVDRNDTLGWRVLRGIIDVFGRWKIIPNLMEAIRQIRLLECFSEGVRIAK